MFDIGFSEIILIFGLALVVLGPEKLPKLAQTVGRWVGRARAMARQFQDQLESEAESMKSSVNEVRQNVEASLGHLKSVAEQAGTAVNEAGQAVGEVHQTLDQAGSQPGHVESVPAAAAAGEEMNETGHAVSEADQPPAPAQYELPMETGHHERGT